MTSFWDVDEVTWIQRHFSQIEYNWTTPGGDYGSVITNMLYTSISSGQWLCVDIPLSIVQDWVDDSDTNHGIIIKPTYEDPPAVGYAKATFSSSECLIPSQRPKLELVYDGPANLYPDVEIDVREYLLLLGESAPISATAIDYDGSVTNVRFFMDGSLIGEDATSPYTVSATPTKSGTRYVTAVAYDNEGAATTSETVYVYTRSLIYEANMDIDPGWTLDPFWEYGQPTGFNDDPTSGYTGPNVIGYNFSGLYENDIVDPKYATTPAIDCSNYNEVAVSFRFWDERVGGDTSRIEVSNDGSRWTTVYIDSERMANLSWVYMDIDITAYAAGQSTVYVRYGMGPTDERTGDGGPNVDDMRVIGYPVLPVLIVDISDESMSESGGSSSATVTRADTSGDLLITLESDDTSEATVTNVTILDGDLSASFNVTAVDDGDADETQTVNIQASAAGYNSGSDTIDVLDDEVYLKVVIDSAMMNENGGSSSATVTRYNSTGQLAVTLDSDDPGEATVTNVTIPNGQNSAVFTVTAVDDGIADGPQNVTITATASGHISDDHMITVADDEFTGMKMKITFAGYDKAETLANFPALVKLNEALSGFLYAQFASTNGWDLLFEDADDEVELNYEVEEWDTNGESYVWVQVPELTNGTYIWAYWGDPANAASPAPCTTNGATWSDEYAGVWHMTEQNAIDSTTNGNTGVAGGSAGVSVLTGGQIGSAIDFPPNASGKGYIGFPGGGSLLMGQSFTFSTWVRWDGSGNPGYCMVASKKNEYNHSDGWCIETHSDNHNVKTLGSSGGGPELDVTVNSVWTDHNWVYLTCVYNGSSVSVYADGGLVGSGGIATVVENAGRDLVLGNDCGYEENNFDGPMDEARCVKALRSADWIWACYSNQVDGSTFCSYDDVEVVGGQTTSNGTPYTWLEEHGITNNQETADISDPDGDGALTWEEYQAGTDPTDSGSVFAVFEMDSQSASNCIVWYGTTNSGVATDFIIYRATNLLVPSWTPVSTNPRSATGTNIWWDESPLQGVPLYYRPALP